MQTATYNKEEYMKKRIICTFLIILRRIQLTLKELLGSRLICTMFGYTVIWAQTELGYSVLYCMAGA
jgi:hypothetical protein